MTLLVMLATFKEETVSCNQKFGLLLGAAGILTLFGVWKGLGNNSTTAVMILLLAVLCYGILFTYIKRTIIPLQLPSEIIATTQMILATLILLLLHILNGSRNNEIKLVPVLAMLVLGVFGSGFAIYGSSKL